LVRANAKDIATPTVQPDTSLTDLTDYMGDTPAIVFAI